MTHTENVHLLFGAGLAFTGLLWLLAQSAPASPLRYAWPTLVFLAGLFLVIPTETQERTYVPVGTWDTFLSVFPNSLDVWLATVRKPHVIQHKTAGLCAMLAGLVELARAAGWITLRGARWVLPVCAVVAGLAVGIHGGTHTHLPHGVEQMHHWVLGGALVLGGTALGYAETSEPRPRLWAGVLPVLLVLAGLDLALLYRVPPAVHMP